MRAGRSLSDGLFAGPAGGRTIRRRDLLSGLAVAVLLALLVAGSLRSARQAGTAAGLSDAIAATAIDWTALRPPSERQQTLPSGRVDHAWVMSQRLSGRLPITVPGGGQLVADLDGRTVRLAGFSMPVQGDPAGPVDRFLLVPYFGACVHVPPPPLNQTVLVRMAQPRALPMFAAVEVTGRLQRQERRTHHDRAGYVIAAQSLLPQPASD